MEQMLHENKKLKSKSYIDNVQNTFSILGYYRTYSLGEQLSSINQRQSEQLRQELNEIEQDEQLQRNQYLRKLISQQFYNPLNIPPNLELSQQHGKFNLVRFSKRQFDEEIGYFCQCCGAIESANELALTCNISELNHLGIGLSLLFITIKCIGLFLLLIFILFGILDIYFNCYYQQQSINEYERQGFKEGILIYQVMNHFTRLPYSEWQQSQKLKNIATLILTLFIFAFCFYLKAKVKKHKKQFIGQEDYSIMLEKINTENFSLESFQQFIKDIFCRYYNLEYIQINYVFDVSKYIEQINLSKKYDIQLAKAKFTQNLEKIKLIKQKIEKIQHQIDQVTYLNLTEPELFKKFIGMIFVSFNSVADTEIILNQQKPYFYYKFIYFLKKILNQPVHTDSVLYTRIYNNSVFDIKRAPAPTNLIWRNLKISSFSRRLRTFVSLILTLIIIGISLFGSIAVNHYEFTQVYNVYAEKKGSLTFFQWLKRALIYIVNALLVLFLEYIVGFIVQYERLQSKSEEQGSKQKKFFWIFFANGIFYPFLQFNISSISFFQQLQFREIKNGPLRDFLLEIVCFNLLTQLLTFFIAEIFTTIFPIVYIYQKLKFKRQIYKEGPKLNLTQQEANLYSEGSKWELEGKYHFYVKIFLYTLFLTSLIPITPLISLCLLYITYWIDKINLLRREHRQPEVNEKILRQLVLTLLICPLLFYTYEKVKPILNVAEPELINKYQINQQNQLKWVLIFTVFTLLIIYIFNLHHKFFYYNNRSQKQLMYNQARIKFITEYQRENPITAHQGLIQWLQYLQETRKIDSQHTENDIQINLLQYTQTSFIDKIYAKIENFFDKTSNIIFQRSYGTYILKSNEVVKIDQQTFPDCTNQQQEPNTNFSPLLQFSK